MPNIILEAKLLWACHRSLAGGMLTRLGSPFRSNGDLQDVAAEILILDDVGELFGDVGGIDLDVLFL
jgi:hypothetical protein